MLTNNFSVETNWRLTKEENPWC